MLTVSRQHYHAMLNLNTLNCAALDLAATAMDVIGKVSLNHILAAGNCLDRAILLGDPILVRQAARKLADDLENEIVAGDDLPMTWRDTVGRLRDEATYLDQTR